MKNYFALKRIVAVMLLMFAACVPLMAQGPLFSNYGYKNLSYDTGVANDIDVYRLETAIDGNVIHLLWVDESVGGVSKMWYRRSNDLGLTWEVPVDLYELTGTGHKGHVSSIRSWKLMSVADGKIHIITGNNDGLEYLTSTDGKEFAKQTVGDEKYINKGFVYAVDGKVAIGYEASQNGSTRIRFAYSGNNGESFTDSLVTFKYGGEQYSTNLQDFCFDGHTMAALTSWSDRWGNNELNWVATSDDCSSFSVNHITTDLVNKDGSVYHNAYTSPKGDHSAHEPYTSIAIDDDRIYVLTSEQLTNDDDHTYTTLHRSTDGGQTWMPAQQIGTDKYKPERQNAYIKVNGDDVYILTEISDYGQYEIRNLIFHSHDAGETFECQTDWTETIHNRGHISDYALCFDPTDDTGNTIYMAGNDYSWVKTTDKFNSIDEVSLNDSNCPDNVGFWDNLYTNLEIDGNGVQHWFIRYCPNGADRHEIIYRRVAGEPAPTATDKVFTVASSDKYVKNRVVVPNNANFHSDAMTMEMWVKVGEYDSGLTFAFLSHSSDQSTNYATSLSLKKDYYNPNGYFTASLCNDKDDHIGLVNNTAPCVPNKWYHLALTYDREMQKACFYVNGVLAEEKEFSGVPGWGWNPIIIGNPSGRTTNFSVDDFRLWNRALTQEEIHDNLGKDITKAEGLKVNIGFDGTLLDLSGNGNDGYGMADVDFADSDIDIPIADFDICLTETGDVVIANHSVGTDMYNWNFGDGTTSTLAQPTHRYSKAGEYTVSLEACNATTFASAVKTVSVAGLTDLQPRRIGNTGKVLATITGGGIKKNQSVTLTRGDSQIKATEVWEDRPGILKAWFEVEEAELGRWSLKVGDATLNDIVTIEEAQVTTPWMEFKGRGKILYNKWLTHTISYGNKGNVDAYNVPLNFMITHYPDLEVEMVDFEYQRPNITSEIMPEDSIQVAYETIEKIFGDYLIVKDAEGKEWRYYPFQAPIIKAGSSQDIHLRLKTSKDLEVRYWASDGWGLLDEESEIKEIRKAIKEGRKYAGDAIAQGECIWNNFSEALLDTGLGLIPGFGCGMGVYRTIKGAITDDAKSRMDNLAWNFGTTAISCLAGHLESIARIGWVASTAISTAAGLAGNAHGAKNCMGGPGDDYKIPTASAWDPNEMIGPSQYMDKDSVHWIGNNLDLPYTILFENKKEATAPAHTVFVTDTLDLTKVDTDDFAFTTVGWGDTIVSVPGEQRSEFAIDIDMRPAKPYIVRATGKLDKETGILNWMLITLNPETLDEEEEPEVGFLPPNDDNHVGEGFVSFIIGQKPELANKTRIENQASIVFDGNAPILTNNFVNAIDTDLPSSAAYLVSDYDDDHLLVQWSGSDESSGVAWYNVYMSTDNDVYQPVKEMFDGESTLVEKKPDTFYYFYTMVTDNVGLSEAKKGTYDVMYDPAVSIESMKSDLVLSRNGEKSYEVLLPVSVKNATMNVFATDGRQLQTQNLGSGSRFCVVLPTAGAHVFVINADGKQYVWKLAGK